MSKKEFWMGLFWFIMGIFVAPMTIAIFLALIAGLVMRDVIHLGH